MERRVFIKTAGAAAVARGVKGANDRVGIALIGCGGEGTGVASYMLGDGNVTARVVCDVFTENAEKARVKLQAADVVKDFRRVLERKDVDAVVIGTPDHWHSIPTVLACQAGKDVYVEKPLAHTIGEGRKMVNAARRYQRIVAIGSQHRSSPAIAEAQQMVQTGSIGKVRFIRVWDTVNRYPAPPMPPDSDPPPGLDWDFWLGPTARIPFNADRWRRWRWFWNTGGGQMTDMGIHWLDTVRQIAGLVAPTSVAAAGGIFELGASQETPDILQVTYEFPGTIVVYEVMEINGRGNAWRSPGRKYYYPAGPEDVPHGILFYGTAATLFVDRSGWDLKPEVKNSADAHALEPKWVSSPDEPKKLHARNFIDCVRSRKTPNAEVEVGHLSTIVTHLGNIAYRTGRKLHWDSAKEEFSGDHDANRMLQTQLRKPYDLI